MVEVELMVRKLKNYDYILLITPVFLAAFGVIMVYSASMVSAVVEGLESTFYLKKQIQWFVIAMGAYIFFLAFPYQYFKRLMKIIILGCIILLLMVLFFGDTVHNATRAVKIAGYSLQPAEFVKLGLIIYLAAIYSKKQAYIQDFAKGVLPPLMITAVIISLIIMQPDLGTSAIVFVIACSIIFSSGVRFKHLAGLFVVCLGFIAVLIPRMITGERISRFVGAYQPFTHPDSTGYHLIQSYVAIGNGGLGGEGLGQSVQKLGYLWGAHTDFIMAIVAEELGVFGVVLVLGMLLLIILRGIFIGRKCKDSFGSFMAIGISTMVAIQAFVNLGAISGVLPITGVPLPFLSYGGSSLLALMIAMGILNNIAKSVKKEEAVQTVATPPTGNNYNRTTAPSAPTQSYVRKNRWQR